MFFLLYGHRFAAAFFNSLGLFFCVSPRCYKLDQVTFFFGDNANKSGSSSKLYETQSSLRDNASHERQVIIEWRNLTCERLVWWGFVMKLCKEMLLEIVAIKFLMEKLQVSVVKRIEKVDGSFASCLEVFLNLNCFRNRFHELWRSFTAFVCCRVNLEPFQITKAPIHSVKSSRKRLKPSMIPFNRLRQSLPVSPINIVTFTCVHGRNVWIPKKSYSVLCYSK